MRHVPFILCLLIATTTPGVSDDDSQFESPTFADMRISRLDASDGSVPSSGSESTDRELVGDCMQTLSLVATSLLVRGDRGGEASSHATLAGAALADGLPVVRARLSRLGDATIPADDRTAARNMMNLFNRDARRALPTLAVAAPDRLDEQLQRIFAPLAEAVGLLSGSTVRSGWWTSDATGVETAATSLPDVRLRELLSEVDWLGDRDRARIRERLATSFAADPDRIEALSEVAEAIESIRALPEGRLLANRLGDRFMEILEFGVGAPPSSSAIVEVGRIVDRMGEYRSLEIPPGMPMPMRRRYADLTREYELAERIILRELDTLLAADSPRTDPSLVAFIKAQAEPLVVVELLARSSQWSDRVRNLDPASTERFGRRIAVLHRELIEPDTRADAIRSLGAIGAVIEDLDARSADAPKPEHTEYRSRLLAGTGTQLDAAWSSAVGDWVGDVADGRSDSPASDRLNRHRRLEAALDRVLALPYDDGDIDVLNRWTGWYVIPEEMSAWRERLELRLRIAATGITESEPEIVDSQLALAEQDLIVLELVHDLRSRVPDDIGELGGSTGLIGRLANPPGDDAWMLEHRSDLARLARSMLELHALRRNGFVDDAAGLERRIADRARGLDLGSAPR